jgi:hypothetical protein
MRAAFRRWKVLSIWPVLYKVHFLKALPAGFIYGKITSSPPTKNNPDSCHGAAQRGAEDAFVVVFCGRKEVILGKGKGIRRCLRVVQQAPVLIIIYLCNRLLNLIFPLPFIRATCPIRFSAERICPVQVAC